MPTPRKPSFKTQPAQRAADFVAGNRPLGGQGGLAVVEMDMCLQHVIDFSQLLCSLAITVGTGHAGHKKLLSTYSLGLHCRLLDGGLAKTIMIATLKVKHFI